jgi:hypothetical protein
MICHHAQIGHKKGKVASWKHFSKSKNKWKWQELRHGNKKTWALWTLIYMKTTTQNSYIQIQSTKTLTQSLGCATLCIKKTSIRQYNYLTIECHLLYLLLQQHRWQWHGVNAWIANSSYRSIITKFIAYTTCLHVKYLETQLRNVKPFIWCWKFCHN